MENKKVVDLIDRNVECYTKHMELLKGARQESCDKPEQKLLDSLILLYFNVIGDMLSIKEAVEGLDER